MKRFLSALLTLSLLIGSVSIATAADVAPQDAANALYTLGLFKGTGVNADGSPVFSLDRAPTRQEAITMLIRLLGKEPAAQNGAWSHPFSDVEPWADKYVGYAYQNGLTKGVSDSLFGGGQSISAAQYLTFVLRSLGYSDANGDFSWDQAAVFSDSLGLTHGEYGASPSFLRGDVVKISYNALAQPMKNSDITLLFSLLDAGVVTKDAVTAAGLSAAAEPVPPAAPLTSEEIYEKCSPAVFYIEVSDAEGETFASGSGFFISSTGKAITNCHVLAGASSAEIKIGDQTYAVSGVYDYDIEKDIALIQVEGSNFSYLRPSTAEVKGGAQVYAIGSPLGLDNTISQGIISNPKRMLSSREYIQTSAAISSGSSGGALLNTYGQVIGITTGSLGEGQNINMAIPIRLIDSLSTDSVKTLQQVMTDFKASMVAYKEFPSVPDFGHYAGVSLASKKVASQTTTYLYRVADLIEVDPDAMTVVLYDDLLWTAGFYHVASSISNGYTYNIYCNDSQTLFISLGMTTLSGVDYFSVNIAKQ